MPGIIHQDKEVFYGTYKYMVTPRYFDSKGILQPLDTKLTKTIPINVAPFSKNNIQLGFTRGFVNRRHSKRISERSWFCSQVTGP